MPLLLTLSTELDEAWKAAVVAVTPLLDDSLITRSKPLKVLARIPTASAVAGLRDEMPFCVAEAHTWTPRAPMTSRQIHQTRVVADVGVGEEDASELSGQAVLLRGKVRGRVEDPVLIASDESETRDGLGRGLPRAGAARLGAPCLRCAGVLSDAEHHGVGGVPLCGHGTHREQERQKDGHVGPLRGGSRAASVMGSCCHRPAAT